MTDCEQLSTVLDNNHFAFSMADSNVTSQSYSQEDEYALSEHTFSKKLQLLETRAELVEQEARREMQRLELESQRRQLEFEARQAELAHKTQQLDLEEKSSRAKTQVLDELSKEIEESNSYHLSPNSVELNPVTVRSYAYQPRPTPKSSYPEPEVCPTPRYPSPYVCQPNPTSRIYTGTANPPIYTHGESYRRSHQLPEAFNAVTDEYHVSSDPACSPYGPTAHAAPEYTNQRYFQHEPPKVYPMTRCVESTRYTPIHPAEPAPRIHPAGPVPPQMHPAGQGPWHAYNSSSVMSNSMNDLKDAIIEGLTTARYQSNQPKIDIEKFNGNPRDYYKFMHRFDANVGSRYMDNQRRLDCLLSLCTGKALKAIEGCIYLDTQFGYHEARKRLKDNFGRESVIVESYLNSLTQGPVLKDGDVDAISSLAYDAYNCYMTLHGWNRTPSLDLQENIAKIYHRFPEAMKIRFDDVCRQLADQDQLPKFSHLTEFLQSEAKRAQSYLRRYDAQVSAKEKTKPNYNFRQRPRPTERVSTFSTQKLVSANTTTDQKWKNPIQQKCPDCGRDHPLWKCDSFKERTVEDRWAIVKKTLCFNCLSSTHKARACLSNRTCRNCSRKHHTLLHRESETSTEGNVAVPSNIESKLEIKGKVAFSHRREEDIRRLKRFKVVPVKVWGSDPTNVVETYAFMDDGSDTSLCSVSLLERLGLKGKHNHCELITANSRSEHNLTETLFVQGIQEPEVFRFNEVVVFDKITDVTQSIPTSDFAKMYPHLEDLDFPEIDSKEVELLLGNDTHEAFKLLEQRTGNYGQPFGLHTALGWTLFGSDYSTETDMVDRSSVRTVNVNFVHQKHSDDQCIEMLSRFNSDFADLDRDFAVSPSVEDKQAQDIMERTVTKVGNHYQVGLPWKPNHCKLPYNRVMAQRRLSYLKKRFERDPALFSKYCEKINEYLDAGHARRIPKDCLNAEEAWYIPHHCTGDKFRVVFDCAAEFQGLSLNSQLLQGPDLTNSLIGVLLRFRQENIAFVADIKGMFHQVMVDPKDRDGLRFLWWPNDDMTLPPVDYQMQVHIFGATSSPSCAAFALRKTAQDNVTGADKETVSTIYHNFYVDDLLKSVSSIEKAVHLIKQLDGLLESGGFHLTKYLSNEKRVLEAIPTCDLAASVMSIDKHELPLEKTLGVYWNASTDNFEIKVRIKPKSPTRRGILSMVSQVYDPLGFVQPFVLPAKKLIQETCFNKLGWDDPVSADQNIVWNNWMKYLPDLEQARIPRCFNPPEQISSRQLHTFCDASQLGYGAVSYIRTVDANGDSHVSFVMGKSRVSPIKSVSVPRLELTSAVLAVKLCQLISHELEQQFDDVVYWTDSTTVLQYILNTSTRFKTFVANRLELIHNASKVRQWRHVDTKRNPADIASRGLMPNDTRKANVWFNGPDFLLLSKDQWPNKPDILPDLQENDTEVRTAYKALSIVSGEHQDKLQVLLLHFSSLHRLQKAVAWLLRFKQVLLHKFLSVRRQCVEPYVGPLSVDELGFALIQIVKLLHQSVFCKEMKQLPEHKSFDDDLNLWTKRQLSKSPYLQSLRKLSPFVVDGILYVGGRLQHSPLSREQKHQIILPSDHHVTNLIIDFYHRREGHCGTLHVLSAVREKFWILRGQATVRKALASCMNCRFWKAKRGEQFMAPLPISRVTPGKPPFTCVGVDYMGPLLIKQCRSQVKRYVCVFTCMATRAVHLEVARTLDTSSFLNVYQRFVCRRGTPEEIFSDNGTNFVGAERELREGIARWNQSNIHDTLRQQGVKWHFSPPSASHQGGVWERMIRSIRKIMRALVGEKLLDDDGLHTFLLEVERILNNRPLTPSSDDPDDMLPLTPNMLLLGRLDASLPPDLFVKADGYRRSWRIVQLLADQFWKRWTKDYLPLLQLRQKWLRPVRNFCTGDIVLMIDDNMKRGHWPKGIVEECYPDRDGVVRRVRVRTTNSTYMRDIRKLCLLEADQ